MVRIFNRLTILVFIDRLMQIELVPEYKFSDRVRQLLTELLVASFPDYPDRSYYKRDAS
jgi:hypothetical protein